MVTLVMYELIDFFLKLGILGVVILIIVIFLTVIFEWPTKGVKLTAIFPITMYSFQILVGVYIIIFGK